MNDYNDLPICRACGTQYAEKSVEKCPICEDPRQFVPASGQAWTSLTELRQKHHNVFLQDPVEKKVWNIYSEPGFGISQRAMVLETPNGNVIWDLIALLDQATVDFIKSIGTGQVQAIVISHPHFYTTNRVWATVFNCPVYIAAEDAMWLMSSPKDDGRLKLIETVNTEIIPGVTAIKCGGHFPGSLCLHWNNLLFSSDTIMTIQGAMNPDEYQTERNNSYSFMWSIPNMIPLDPKTIFQIWSRLKPFEFDTTYGNLPGRNVRSKELKKRLLQSAKIQVRSMGWEGKEEGKLVLQEQL